MKDKRVNYILIPVVLAVWGIVFYKIFGSLSGSHKVAVINYDDKSSMQEQEDSSFKLIADYRDPFQGESFETASKQRPRGSDAKSKVTNEEKSPETKWPAINFLGTIKKQKEIFAIMKIHNKTFTMKKGEEIENVKMLMIMKDSVQIQYQGTTKIIGK